MWKRIARAIVPAPVRRFLQRWKLERQVRAFPRRVVEHCYAGEVLRVELADGLAAGWYDHDWGPMLELELLARGRLRGGAVVFDLGAHQGVVGLILGRRVGAAGRVVLVEASAHNTAQCARNVTLNGMPWVEPLHAAVADREGTLAFNGGLNGAAAEVSDYAGRVEVPAVTVDGLARRYGRPGVVFVDVEGFECRALAAAADTLTGPTDWFVEVHVGCGLEAAGGSAEQVLASFPAERFERFVHAEEDPRPMPAAEAPDALFRRRFFLTALSRQSAAGA